SRPPPSTDPPGAGPGLAAGTTVEFLGPITLLLRMVSWVNSTVGDEVQTPPPLTEALLAVMIDWSIVSAGPVLAMPPPLAALLPESVTSSRLRMPWFRMPPPFPVVDPSSMIRLLRDSLPVVPTWNTRL